MVHRPTRRRLDRDNPRGWAKAAEYARVITPGEVRLAEACAWRSTSPPISMPAAAPRAERPRCSSQRRVLRARRRLAPDRAVRQPRIKATIFRRAASAKLYPQAVKAASRSATRSRPYVGTQVRGSRARREHCASKDAIEKLNRHRPGSRAVGTRASSCWKKLHLQLARHARPAAALCQCRRRFRPCSTCRPLRHRRRDVFSFAGSHRERRATHMDPDHFEEDLVAAVPAAVQQGGYLNIACILRLGPRAAHPMLDR